MTSIVVDSEERFIIHFEPHASGEIALQSEKHGFYLQWTGTEMRCFSKEPVWWGMRLGMHPQVEYSNEEYFIVKLTSITVKGLVDAKAGLLLRDDSGPLLSSLWLLV